MTAVSARYNLSSFWDGPDLLHQFASVAGAAVTRIAIHDQKLRDSAGSYPNVRARPLFPPCTDTCEVSSCVFESVLGAWMFALIFAVMLPTRAAAVLGLVQREHRKTMCGVPQRCLGQRPVALSSHPPWSHFALSPPVGRELSQAVTSSARYFTEP